MDAIHLIERDHRTIEQLFGRLERAIRDRDPATCRRLLRDVVRELSVHATVEEQFLYPALREAGVDDPVLDALEEHHAVKLTLAELEAMGPDDERYAAKVRLLVANVREHVEEEERALLPVLRRALDAGHLRELGDTLDRARRVAPTRPHPAAPDTPPGNLVSGAMAAIVDRSRDAMLGGAEMLRLVAVRGAERSGDAARLLARSALRRGRAAADDAQRRGRAAAREARETIEDVAGVGAETVDDVRERGRELAEVVGERGQEGARRVQNGSRAVARQVRRPRRTGGRKGARNGKAQRPGR